jgi:hypothetical protein
MTKNTIDKKMMNFVARLRLLGVVTLASCDGDNVYHPTVVCAVKRGNPIEIISGVEIPRIKRFYVKDLFGRYYIPEVENYWNAASERRVRRK